jgi:hypothetical protein
MFPVRENANVVLLEMKTLTNYAGIGFRILFIKYLYLFVCFIQIISYSDNFINNKCKQ